MGRELVPGFLSFCCCCPGRLLSSLLLLLLLGDLLAGSLDRCQEGWSILLQLVNMSLPSFDQVISQH